jgi:NDP-sugar pyrophosphorylase family protein
MKAMVLAAGMGTRLLPLTSDKPKALVDIDGTPMLEIVLKKIIRSGFNEIIINVHHFAGQILDFLKKNDNFGASIAISDETDFLLDTGGGLLKASGFFNDNKPFLVHNIDILSNINLQDLYNYHCSKKPLATLAVKERTTSRSLLINKEGELSGWHNNQTGETIISNGREADLVPIAFSAIHVMDPAIFPLIKETGKFSIMDTYLRLASTHKIQTFRHDNDFWFDIGRIENLKAAAPYSHRV